MKEPFRYYQNADDVSYKVVDANIFGHYVKSTHLYSLTRFEMYSLRSTKIVTHVDYITQPAKQAPNIYLRQYCYRGILKTETTSLQYCSRMIYYSIMSLKYQLFYLEFCQQLKHPYINITCFS